MTKRMKDTWIKLRDLMYIVLDIPSTVQMLGLRSALRVVPRRVHNWYHDVWKADLDDLLCCSGFDTYSQTGCGCYGMTIREALENYHEFRTAKSEPFDDPQDWC